MADGEQIGVPGDEYNDRLRLGGSTSSRPIYYEDVGPVCVVVQEPSAVQRVRERLRATRENILQNALPCMANISSQPAQRYAESQAQWRFVLHTNGWQRPISLPQSTSLFHLCITRALLEYRTIVPPRDQPALVVSMPPDGWVWFAASPPAGVLPSRQPALFKLLAGHWTIVVPY